MKTKNLLKIAAFAMVIGVMASCAPAMRIVPQAINTVNTVHFDELNLERKDYNIVNTITAEASIVYTANYSNVTIKEAQNEFELKYVQGQKAGENSVGYILNDFDGVVRLGYLTNDYANGASTDYQNPEDIVRRLAIYRLINMAKEQGADGVIEPLVSTNVEQIGRHAIMFTTTVSAKCVKIKVQ